MYVGKPIPKPVKTAGNQMDISWMVLAQNVTHSGTSLHEMKRTKRTNVIRDAYLRKPRKNRIIVLEDLNFMWDEPELKEITEMWELGGDVRLIAKHFDRDPDEILLALIHLARKDRIIKREGGLLLGL